MNTMQSDGRSSANPVILLTGGAGFVGRAIMEELRHAQPVLQPAEVRIFDRVSPEIPTDSSFPIRYIAGDVLDFAALNAACRGVDIVIHLANLVDWGTHPESLVFAVNVDGTRNVLNACRENGVPMMVFTSTLDVVFTGRPQRGIDESWPYPARHIGAYSRSKVQAEQIVVEANGESLKTVVLRPSGIYGERDPYHLGTIAKMAQKGLVCRMGSGNARCMNIYVGNVAHAHLLAARALWAGNNAVAGQTYFLIDHEPMNFFDCVLPILETAGFRMRFANLKVPHWLLVLPALASEAAATLVRPFKRIHPPLSRFALAYLCNDFIIATDKARRDFGFEPRYSREEAIRRSADWVRTTFLP
jgi:nucleoside-diphosphate-sugar epimerase